MRTWKMIGAVNGGALIGFVISLFIVPPRTPVWMWMTFCAAFLLLINYIFFVRKRKNTVDGQAGRTGTVVVTIGFLILLVELLVRFLTR